MNPKINEIVIDGETYVPKSTVVKEFDGDMKIVVLQRGWVYVGFFERDGYDCKLHNSHCIRVWGTTKGLQELVNGPTRSTKLDKCDGVVEFDYLTVVHTITVNKNKWNL